MVIKCIKAIYNVDAGQKLTTYSDHFNFRIFENAVCPFHKWGFDISFYMSPSATYELCLSYGETRI